MGRPDVIQRSPSDDGPAPSGQGGVLARRLVAGAVIGCFAAGALFVASWGTARPMSRREACWHGLRPTAQQLARYADEAGGRMPDRLADLVHLGRIDSWGLICPRSDLRPPPGATVVEQAKELYRAPELYCSYVYLGRGVNRRQDPDAAVLYEPARSPDEALLVLRADGEVVWLQGQARQDFLARAAAGNLPVRVPRTGG